MHEASRLATNADRDAIVDLVNEGRASIADVRGGAMWLRVEAPTTPVPELVAAAIDDPDRAAVVATIDDVPLGFMLLECRRDAHGAIADVGELYVTPEARGVGLGEAMMATVEAFAEANDCDGITSRALPGDRATKNYFETFGLVARSIEVYRSRRT